MTLRVAVLQGTKILEEAAVPSARLTAELLLAHALGKDRVYLIAHSADELTELAWIHYGRYLHERTLGKPTQYITKVQEFFGRPFQVSPAVLIPRPETEHLVDAVLKLLPLSGVLLDIGAGSGAIAVSVALERPGASVFASDISIEAIAVAQSNTEALGGRVAFAAGDLAEAFRDGTFDVVASNPPYVPRGDEPVLQREVRYFEPAVALYGGDTGVEIYARLIPSARRVLKPGGHLALELGYNSLERVHRMLAAGPWRNIILERDLAGIPRVLTACYLP